MALPQTTAPEVVVDVVEELRTYCCPIKCLVSYNRYYGNDIPCCPSLMCHVRLNNFLFLFSYD